MKKDITGQTFGRLTAVAGVGKDKRGASLWLCSCSCGRAHVARLDNLTGKKVESCGCLWRQRVRESNTSHGLSTSSEYASYRAAKHRCQNGHPDYHARGIRFLWESFEQFIAELGMKPHPSWSLERHDVNGHYEPSNCYWASPKTQANNRRAGKLKQVFIPQVEPEFIAA